MFIFCFPVFCFCVLGATPTACGGSQAQDQIGAGAVSASLHHSYSNARSKPHLPATLQLAATPDLLTACARTGIEPISS